MRERLDSDLRRAVPGDAAAIAQIYNESIEAGNATMDDRPKSEEEIRAQIEGHGEREGYWLLEEAGGEVLGWGVIKRYSDRLGYRFACETAVYLRREQVGRGLGTRIKLALFELCRGLQYHHLVAKVFAENSASIEYNLRLGYEIVGRQRQIGFKNGRWQDVVILQRILEPTDNDPPIIPAPTEGDAPRPNRPPNSP